MSFGTETRLHPGITRAVRLRPMQLTPAAFVFIGICHAPFASAQVDDFEGGANPNGWTFGVSTPDVVEPTGGNPGGWLHNPSVDSFAPILEIGAGSNSAFVGDLRANGVTRIAIDAITNSASFGAGGRNFSLVLRDSKGTPSPNDDDYAYFVGPLVPQIGQGWSSYSFDIPSQSTAPVPAGWSGGWSGDPGNFRPGVTWSDVIENVDAVEFWWLDPSFAAIFQQWDVGVDNISVEGAIGFGYCGGQINSTGLPGTATATGSAVVLDNDVTLIARNLPTGQFGIWLTSRTQGFIPGPTCPTNLCLASPIGRFNAPGQILNTGMAGTYSLQIDLTALPQMSGTVSAMAGETWNFQSWHRDINGCGSSFTSAVELMLN